MSVEESDVNYLGASSTPYISSGLADAAGVTETNAEDDTGDTGATAGATAAAESALLHTEGTETLDLGATDDTHADTGLEVVASNAETGDTGESVAISTSDPLSITTASADVAPPTATVDSAAGSAPTASPPSVSSVPASAVDFRRLLLFHLLLPILIQNLSPKWPNHRQTTSSLPKDTGV